MPVDYEKIQFNALVANLKKQTNKKTKKKKRHATCNQVQFSMTQSSDSPGLQGPHISVCL